MSTKENYIENMDKNEDGDYDYVKNFVIRILMNEDKKEKWVHMWTYMFIE